jgi:hypothetical protein
MKLNSKLTWGAAWTGLALIVAVPSADFLTGKGNMPAALITSDTDPVKAIDPATTASITPAAPTPGLMPDARKITLAPVSTPAVTATPAVTTTPKIIVGAPTPTGEPTATTEEPEVQTASLGISATNPPFPAPLSQRPKELVRPGPTVIEAPTSVATVEAPGQMPVVLEPAPNAPLIIDEEALAERVAVTDPDRPVPPAGIANDPAERQTLDEYLAQRGLLDDGNSSAVVTYSDASDEYDPDGFYLNDGPNNDSRHMTRAQWRRWLLARGVDPDELEPF